MEDGTYLVMVEGGQETHRSPYHGVTPGRRAALEQAVTWANGQAAAMRQTAEQVVAAATKFEEFLIRPGPDTSSAE